MVQQTEAKNTQTAKRQKALDEHAGIMNEMRRAQRTYGRTNKILPPLLLLGVPLMVADVLTTSLEATFYVAYFLTLAVALLIAYWNERAFSELRRLNERVILNVALNIQVLSPADIESTLDEPRTLWEAMK